MALVVFYPSIAAERKDSIIDKIHSFAKLYGYTKYFHPSSEAAKIDWNTFAVYSIKKIISDKKDLKEVLIELFTPIAPSIHIVNDKANSPPDIQKITSDDITKYCTITWQHLGLGTPGSVYSSKRVLNNCKRRKDPLFKDKNEIGDFIIKDIGSGLKCVLPLALYEYKGNTYPKGDSLITAKLKGNLKELRLDSNANGFEQRVAGIVILWNEIKHFHPYLPELNVDWEKALEDALYKSFQDTSLIAYKSTLRKMTTLLNDGHLYINFSANKSNVENSFFMLPIDWEWIENEVVITQIFEKNLYGKLKKGDIVKSINGTDILKVIEKKEELISSSTPLHKRYKALGGLLLSSKDSSLSAQIIRDNKIININIPFSYSYSNIVSALKEVTEIKFKEISNNILYANLTSIEDKDIPLLLSKSQDKKGLILDLRGYPKSHLILCHLLTQKDTSSHWMQTPQLIRPDFENVSFRYQGWALEPKSPNIAAKVILLIDYKAISYSESVIGFFENYKLATIIGQPSAGTNGNVNVTKLPGGISAMWTGMKVVKHNGGKIYEKGFIPDIIVNPTIQDIKNGRDSMIEAATKLLEKGM